MILQRNRVRWTTSDVGVLSLLVTTVAFGAGCSAGEHVVVMEAPQETEEATPAGIRIYRADGTRATEAQLVSSLDTVEVVLFGEQHGDSAAHALQLALLERAVHRYDRARDVVLSLEMLERDVQVVVDEYLAGLITKEHFLQGARLGPSFDERYGRLIEFARSQGLPVVASNAPRRYANLVSRRGPEALQDLSAEAQRWLPPLPYPPPSSAYREKWTSLMQQEEQAQAHQGHATPADTSTAQGSTPETSNLLFAQALWDAAMAASISESLERHAAPLVLHIAGAFHISGGTGIPEQLQHLAPDRPVLTIVAVQAQNVEAFSDAEYGGAADFIVLTPGKARAE